MEARDAVLSAEPPPEPQPSVPDRPRVLYDLPQQHKPEYWQFIQLAAKHEFEHLPKHLLKSKHAEFAYCTKCECSIRFQTGQSGVKVHMETVHVGELDQTLQNAKRRSRSRSARNLINTYSTPPAQDGGKAAPKSVTKEQQKHANELLAYWIARSLRPISIVEDEGFREYVEYVTTRLGGVTVNVPARSAIKQEIVRVAAELRASLKTKLSSECNHYCVTTDVWTDQPGRSYISFTLHYLDEEFNSYNWTLEVEPLSGRHTGEAIAQAL